VVRGAARVTINELVKMVHENESIYIPIGSVHRLENPGKILLELTEVQTGSYLGEDDIIRIEDDYQRSRTFFPSVNDEIAGVQRAESDIRQSDDVMISKIDQRIMTAIGRLE
jgi:hypothetical protein